MIILKRDAMAIIGKHSHVLGHRATHVNKQFLPLESSPGFLWQDLVLPLCLSLCPPSPVQSLPSGPGAEDALSEAPHTHTHTRPIKGHLALRPLYIFETASRERQHAPFITSLSQWPAHDLEPSKFAKIICWICWING